MGNQLVFRVSFSVAAFFLARTALARFAPPHSRRRALQVLLAVEIPTYLSLLVGSFFIPSSAFAVAASNSKHFASPPANHRMLSSCHLGFFHGYAQAARVLSGLFILFQITSIVDFSCKPPRFLLDRD